jgi:hypothetical protein
MSCGQDGCCQSKEVPPAKKSGGAVAVIDALKPFLIAVLIIAAGVLQFKQVIDTATFNLIISVLGGSAVAAVQTAQKRVERKTDRALRSLIPPEN